MGVSTLSALVGGRHRVSRKRRASRQRGEYRDECICQGATEETEHGPIVVFDKKRDKTNSSFVSCKITLMVK